MTQDILSAQKKLKHRSTRRLAQEVHSNFIYNSPKLETAHCPPVVHLTREKLNCGTFIQRITTQQWEGMKLEHTDGSQSTLKRLTQHTLIPFTRSSQVAKLIHGENTILAGRRDGRCGSRAAEQRPAACSGFGSHAGHQSSSHGTLNICSLSSPGDVLTMCTPKSVSQIQVFFQLPFTHMNRSMDVQIIKNVWQNITM